jgi:predicted XRE-type DNA-binding protein
MKGGTGMTTTTPTTTMHTGSRNIFADLGLPDPERELLRAHLTLHIYRIVKERGLTTAQAGEILKVKPQHAAALMRNRAAHFSVGQLMEFLILLGQDIEVTVRPSRVAKGEKSIAAPAPLPLSPQPPKRPISPATQNASPRRIVPR